MYLYRTPRTIDNDVISYYRQHYKLYLQTIWWQELNVQLIDSNPDAKCYICQKTNTLLLHHVKYDNLFREVLFKDVYILCFNCHTRTHFKLNGEKIPVIESVLVKRMKLLKYTNPIRTFRLGSSINALWDYMLRL
jgi:RNase P subunit RPR2